MYSVLIVEDDPMVAMVNEKYITKNPQFKVVEKKRNGQEALYFLENHSVDLIILDVYMPIMDGFETLKQIREKNIPVDIIMVTAANDTQTFENTMHLGIIDYLVKPFAYERLQIALEKFAAKKSALQNTVTLDQQNIDSIISHSAKITQKEYPKGIQPKTLELITEFFDMNSGWITGDTLSEKIGLSSVTIRHYMNFLVGQNLIEESINYETGGRPSMLYKKRKN